MASGVPPLARVAIPTNGPVKTMASSYTITTHWAHTDRREDHWLRPTTVITPRREGDT